MESLGELLKETRTNLNFSLSQVAKDTYIDIKYLEALEEEEFSVFPGEAYLKGFLRTYASYLKLDPDIIIEKYQKIKIAETPTPIEQLIPKPKFNFKPIFYIGIIIIILPFLGFGVFKIFTGIKKYTDLNKKNNEKKVFIIKETDIEQKFNLRKDDVVEIEFQNQKHILDIKQLDPVKVSIDNLKENEYYLAKNIQYQIDLNKDEIKDINLMLNYWDKKIVNLSIGFTTQDSQYFSSLKGENPESITKQFEQKNIDLTLSIKEPCLLKYKIDNENEVEVFCTSQSQKNLIGKQSIIIWLSNAGIIEFNFPKFNKLYTPGQPGEIKVKLIKWEKISTGEYELSISSLN